MSSSLGPARAELLELYRISIDEYRFQIQLNWTRIQYFVALNLGITTLGVTGLQLGSDIAGFATGGFIAGVACSGLAMVSIRVQHDYYRAARDHMRHVEERLGLGELALKTTPGLGSRTGRIGRVTTFASCMLLLVLAVDVAGLLYALSGE